MPRTPSTALNAGTIHVSIGSFLDLRYLVDSGRLSQQVLGETRSIVNGDAFTVVPLDLPVIDRMASISKDEVSDPFDRIIAATALATDLPLSLRTSAFTTRSAIGSSGSAHRHPRRPTCD